MSGIATAVVASAVVGGVVANNASKRAANAQTESVDKANELATNQFNQNREDMKPWREAGTQTLAQLVAGTGAGGEFNRDFNMSDFQKDPGYQFRMDEGMKGLERSAAARGGLLNGGTLKEIARYGQDYASGEYGKAYDRYNNNLTTRFNRLSSIAGIGQTATTQGAQQGTQLAQTLGENAMQAGNARASSYVGSANAVNGAAQTIGNYFTTQQIMKQFGSKPPVVGSTPMAQNVTPTYN